MKVILTPLAAVAVLLSGCRGGNDATLATFAANYYGHDRARQITPGGRAYEDVNSGCCYLVIELRFQLS
jgi:hypothetical protein